MPALYQALIALLAANFDSDYPVISTAKFSGRPIFQGYQNNYTIPANGKYVLVTAQDEENQILNPNSVTNVEESEQTFSTLLSSIFQVDFYGDNAQQNARTFHLLMNSNGYANEFFTNNDFACTVNRVTDVFNLSQILGRDMYTPRFMVKCSLFNNPVATVPLAVYDGFTNNIRLAEIQE